MISVQDLVRAVILLVCLGLVFWLLWWLVNFINPPEPFRKVATVVLAVAAVLACVGVLMSLAGMPLVRW